MGSAAGNPLVLILIIVFSIIVVIIGFLLVMKMMKKLYPKANLCPKCGCEVPQGKKFCKNCGATLVTDTKEE